MPLFYIHSDDGDIRQYDEEGYDYPDLASACNAAITALPGMAKDKLPEGPRRTFRVEVEDDRHRALYEATLEFVGISKSETSGTP